MATRKTVKKSELAQAGAHLGDAAQEVGTAVVHKLEALGDAVSTGVKKAKKTVMAQGNKVSGKISGLVKAAEGQLKKAQAELNKAGEAARKSVLSAEKKLEATRRSTGKKLAALQASAGRKATDRKSTRLNSSHRR